MKLWELGAVLVEVQQRRRRLQERESGALRSTRGDDDTARWTAFSNERILRSRAGHADRPAMLRGLVLQHSQQTLRAACKKKKKVSVSGASAPRLEHGQSSPGPGADHAEKSCRSFPVPKISPSCGRLGSGQFLIL